MTMQDGPVVIATWAFGATACRAAWDVLSAGGRALDSVERGAIAVEDDPAVDSVGYGGLPNAEGVVELDAAIMDGVTHGAGAVVALTGVPHPTSVARRVMEVTPHVMLAGQNARRFALEQGFPEQDMLTREARAKWEQWKAGGCATPPGVSHDTVGICALDRHGDLAAACTTSGLRWKAPGRVGDTAIVGSGLYVDNEVGAAACTGNGDEIMKCCLSYRIVDLIARGMSAQEACEEAIGYLIRKRPGFESREAACIALSRDGSTGAAAGRGTYHPSRANWRYAVARGQEPELFEGPYIGDPAA